MLLVVCAWRLAATVAVAVAVAVTVMVMVAVMLIVMMIVMLIVMLLVRRECGRVSVSEHEALSFGRQRVFKPPTQPPTSSNPQPSIPSRGPPLHR